MPHHHREWERAAEESQRRADRRRIEALNQSWFKRMWPYLLFSVGLTILVSLIVLQMAGY